MELFQRINELSDKQIEKIYRKVSAKAIVLPMLAMEDVYIERFKLCIPIGRLDETNAIVTDLQEMRYTREELIKETQAAYKELEKAYHDSRLRNLFKRKK